MSTHSTHKVLVSQKYELNIKRCEIRSYFLILKWDTKRGALFLPQSYEHLRSIKHERVILGIPLCPAESFKLNLGVCFDSDFFLVRTCAECLQKLFCATP